MEEMYSYLKNVLKEQHGFSPKKILDIGAGMAFGQRTVGRSGPMPIIRVWRPEQNILRNYKNVLMKCT